MILANHVPIIQILFPLFGALLSIISFRFITFARIITTICILSSLWSVFMDIALYKIRSYLIPWEDGLQNRNRIFH